MHVTGIFNVPGHVPWKKGVVAFVTMTLSDRNLNNRMGACFFESNIALNCIKP
jgi:hypothetical protein